MFVNGVEFISSRLENISLNLNYQRNMQPMSERPPLCPKAQPPHLHLTPSDGGQKKTDGSPQGTDNPWLLKPQHEIPATPPPQRSQEAINFFPQRIG
ncbi:unnamed protein product, partial [Iphiclides podalirius]